MIEVKKISKPWTRVFILIAGLILILILSHIITGTFLPTDPKDALIFQNALLLIVLSSALLENKFTKPADSAINGLMGMLTLIPVYGLPNIWLWWGVFGYCGIICVLAMTCVSVSSGPELSGWRKWIAETTNRPAVVLGKAKILYSIVFLYAVLSFYGIQSKQTMILVIFWGFFLALWPLGLPDLLGALRFGKTRIPLVGVVVRTDAPNIIHASIGAHSAWDPRFIRVLQQGDGKQRYIIPLFFQSQGSQILGTGLCLEEVSHKIKGLESGCLYDPGDIDKSPEELLGGDINSKLIGFIDQNSTISQIRFHTWNPSDCSEGRLVWSKVGNKRVYYQIVEGVTNEEGLETDRHGYQTAVASQLGTLSAERGFEKFPWLPGMTTPVFIVPSGFGEGIITSTENEFKYGTVPGTSIEVLGPFNDMLAYHTAILGVTGSGKTEFAYDLLRFAVSRGTKVISIDLTSRHEGRLADLQPHNLSISPELSEQLSEKLLDAETGAYGAGAEKRALKQFADSLALEVKERVREFLTSTDENKRLGIITLNEISNTKATLYITEIYLTTLLHFAKDNPTIPPVLLVVEEAHTVMPETSTMGLGDYDSRGLVAKIAQIALQGRKYRVGLLIIAQRTATVSKTVLTQCNTIVSFSCFDDTSLGFFQNFFGKTYTEAIPNLQFLQAVIFGKALKSQRPLIVQVPYDEEKARRTGGI